MDGQLRQNYETSDMDHQIKELIAWGSSVVTMEPGDVIACGTNHQGLGAMQDGDHVEIEIDKVGKLAVNVSDARKRTWPKQVDEAMAAQVRDTRRAGSRR